jgi:hypothetical protein
MSNANILHAYDCECQECLDLWNTFLNGGVSDSFRVILKKEETKLILSLLEDSRVEYGFDEAAQKLHNKLLGLLDAEEKN